MLWKCCTQYASIYGNSAVATGLKNISFHSNLKENWKLSEVTQFCRTLCIPMDCSLPGFSIHAIFQTREYWSGLAFPSPGDLPDPGIEPGSPKLEAEALTHMRWIQLGSSLNILWNCLSLGLEGKLTFSSPEATAEFPYILAYWVQHFHSIIF